MLPLRFLLLLVFSCAAAFAAAAPSLALPRSTPEAQGVASAAILDFVTRAEEKIDALHSFILVRHGQVVAETWWAPYGPAEPHQMFSLSKSFTSTAVGLAIADGKLSIEDPVLGFFPGEAPEKPSANLRAMRVRDLLTMSTGHHNEDIQNFNFGADDSLVKRFLALPVTHKPGTFFVYNTPATYMLSAIVQKVTGQTVLAYLQPRLFVPLGIAEPTWEASKQGISMGGFGLSIRTEDIAKFGQLYVQKGQWQGKQIVPAAWVATATSRWMSNGSAPNSDWEQGYGFQFWRCRYGVVRGDGAHGQYCIMFPEQDAVLAITAGTRDLQGVLNVVWEKLLPALQVKTLPADPAAHAALQAKLGNAALKVPATIPPPPLAPTLAGRRYIFPKNPLAIEAVGLAPSVEDPGATDLTVTLAGAEEKVLVASTSWIRGELKSGPMAGLVALKGGWTAADAFSLTLVRYRTPFVMNYRLRFADDELRLEIKANVGQAAATLVGKRE